MGTGLVGSGGLHPRLSVSGLCFPDLLAVDAVAAVRDLGVKKTSITAGKLRQSGPTAVRDECRRLGIDIVSTTGLIRLDPSVEIDEAARQARADIDQSVAVGATSLYTLTGRRTRGGWAASLEAYAEFVEGLVDYAQARNLVLAVEPTNWLYADLNFVHSFHDALRLAGRTGMKVCLDVFHVWTEGDLLDDISRNMPLISTVQVSDMTPGSRALPCRAVPGEGQVQIDLIVRRLLDAGYDGPFEIELNGPRIDEVGHRESAARSAMWLSSLLTELGA